MAEDFRDNACRVVSSTGSEAGFHLKVNQEWYGAYNHFDAETGKEIFVNMRDGNLVSPEDPTFGALQKFRDEVRDSNTVKHCPTDYGRSSS